MTAKQFSSGLLSILLCTSLCGCIFEIESLYSYDYPIQPDGSVDLTLAPMEEIQNFTMLGFYDKQFGNVEIQPYCEDEFQIGVPTTGFRPLSDQVTTNSQSVYFTGVNPLYQNVFSWPSCWHDQTSDGNYEVQVAVRAGGFWLPILSEENMACITNKALSERQHYLQAATECLALDARASDNALGLNPSDQPPQEINILKVKIPAAYVSYSSF